MSNVAFDLEVLKKVSAAITPPGNAKIAALGAIGPDLLQYIPISNKLSTALADIIRPAIQGLTDAQVQAGQRPTLNFSSITGDPTLFPEYLEKPLMVAYSILFQFMVVPFWPTIQRDINLLNQLQTVANNQDGNALKSMASATPNPFDQLTSDAADLQNKLPRAILGVLAAMPFPIAAPPAIEFPAADKPWLPQLNRPFEFLRWHLTNIFAKNLVSLADTNDKKAYTYGHFCHIAASVTGKPFINNIVGGPYRTHWWRNRFVSNFVDAWTFGFYASSGSSTTPSPSWSTICTANLQELFNVAGFTVPADDVPDAVKSVASGTLGSLPSQFPSDLADFIEAAFEASYPAMFRPKGFTSEAIKEAFVGLYAVVWFMTSGFGPMTTFTLGSAPSSCTQQPTWVTQHGSPPSPQQSGPSTGATVCGVLLAILALILFITQNWAGGVSAVVGAIAAFTSGGGIDWDQLACNIFWLRSGLLSALSGLQDGLVKGALAYPQPTDLANPSNQSLFQTTWAGSIWAPAAPYPLQMDKSVGPPDVDWISYPTASTETPQTMSFMQPPCFPNTVIDGSGLQNGGMLAGNDFPTANAFFGDALANAKQIIPDQAKKLPSFNLDGDRGYGWLTWGPQPTAPVPADGQVNNPIKE